MKKFRLSIFVVLLCSILVFSGCTKASSATPQKICSLYTEIATKYKKDSSNKTQVFDDYNAVDLYSSASYRSLASTEIVHENSGASYSILNLVRDGGEYATIMSAVSNFYQIGPSFYITDYEIPQEKLSKMYEAIDSLTSTIKPLVSKKNVFQNNLESMGASKVNSVPVTESFKSYLGYYRDLIQKFYEFNSIYEDIYTTNIYVPNEESTMLIEGELKRLVLSVGLYLGEYYYQKQMVANVDYSNRFSYQYVYDPESSSNIANSSFDEGFANFRKIVTGAKNIADPEELGDENYVAYYNVGLTKLKSLKNMVKNYTVAAKVVADYYSHDKTISTNSTDYAYVEYMATVDAEVINLQNYFVHYLVD